MIIRNGGSAWKYSDRLIDRLSLEKVYTIPDLEVFIASNVAKRQEVKLRWILIIVRFCPW